jgi:hypothetical protein
MLLLSGKIVEQICQTNSLTSSESNALIPFIGYFILIWKPKATYHRNWVSEIDFSLLIGRDVMLCVTILKDICPK